MVQLVGKAAQPRGHLSVVHAGGPDHTDQAARITGSVFSLAGNTYGLYSDPEIIRSVSKPLGEHWTVDELVKNADRMLFAGYRSVTDQYK